MFNGHPDMISATIEISPSEEKGILLIWKQMLRNPPINNCIPISAKARSPSAKQKDYSEWALIPKSRAQSHTSYTIGKEDFRVPDWEGFQRTQKRDEKVFLAFASSMNWNDCP